jgi:hypothetical protein
MKRTWILLTTLALAACATTLEWGTEPITGGYATPPGTVTPQGAEALLSRWQPQGLAQKEPGWLDKAKNTGATPQSGVPVIRRYQITHVDAGTWMVVLETFDPQADLFGGTCNLAYEQSNLLINRGSGRIPITELGPGANPKDPEMDVLCAVRFDPPADPGTPFDFRISVTDKAGHMSNTVSGHLLTEKVVGASEGDNDAPMRFAGGTATLVR